MLPDYGCLPKILAQLSIPLTMKISHIFIRMDKHSIFRQKGITVWEDTIFLKAHMTGQQIPGRHQLILIFPPILPMMITFIFPMQKRV